jgi:hypothetical protein
MQTSDLRLYKSKTISDTNSNGGREGYAEVQSGQLHNVFPPVPSSEREAGGSRLRKVFFHVLQDGVNARAWLKGISTSEDHFALIEGDHEDTQGDLTGNEKKYATGTLAQQAGAGTNQVVVDFEDAQDVDLADGDPVWLYGTNGEEFNRVSGTPTWNGNQATINLASQLTVDYPQGSICAMVLEIGTLQPSFDSWQENSSQGTYDEEGHPPELENWGTVRDDWTITFTSPTEFSCSGLYEGNVGSGNISSDFAPVNPNTGNPYFTLRAAGWGGTWQAGDTITFKTYPSSKGLWLKEIWPAGASSTPENQLTLQLYAE